MKPFNTHRPRTSSSGRALLTSAFIFIWGMASFAQGYSAKTLNHDWVVSKGWFGDEQIVLQVLDSSKTKDLSQVLRFNMSGILTTSLYNPGKYGLCGNGLIYFDVSTWEVSNNVISFDVKGGRIADSQFHYIMSYAITGMENGKMTLKKKEVKLNENKTF